MKSPPAQLDLPPVDALLEGAVALLRRHFDAINTGDYEAFRSTAYIFPQVDGAPLSRWWEGMRSLAPLTADVTPVSGGDHVSLEKEPHVSLWARVCARSEATRRSYEDDFVVWYLPETAEWKLACRIHWWSARAADAQM